MSRQDDAVFGMPAAGEIDDALATKSILDTLRTMKENAGFLKLVTDADLGRLLERGALQTLFAPGNEAMAKADVSDVQDLVAKQMLGGAARSYDIALQRELKTLAGNKIAVRRDGEDLRIGGAKIVRSDIACTNGVIHVVDGLL
jgi:uncharacterized surface protein with fasciclin (FAS1) repeats